MAVIVRTASNLYVSVPTIEELEAVVSSAAAYYAPISHTTVEASEEVLGHVRLAVSTKPEPLGINAKPGTTGKAADAGHVHRLPTLGELGAAPSTHIYEEGTPDKIGHFYVVSDLDSYGVPLTSVVKARFDTVTNLVNDKFKANDDRIFDLYLDYEKLKQEMEAKINEEALLRAEDVAGAKNLIYEEREHMYDLVQEATSELHGYIQEVEGNLNEEIETRADEAADIRKDLSAEVERATKEEDTLLQQITDELNRATQAESALGTRITAEENARTELDSRLTKNFNDEHIERVKKENEILHYVDEKSDYLDGKWNEALIAETDRATGVENAFTTRLDTEEKDRKSGDALNAANITKEKDRATNKEEGLEQTIIANRKYCEEEATKMESRLSGEITDAKNELQGNIDNLSNSTDTRINDLKSKHDALSHDLESEVTRATEAETKALEDAKAYTDVETARAKETENQLQTNIETETSRAQTAEAQALTDAKAYTNKEQSRAEAAEKKNADAISAEQTRATTAEGSLQTAISNETTRATEVEESLQQSIDSLDTDLDSEVTRATAAEQANADAITAETTRAKAVEKANANAIDSEKTRAEQAEDDLYAYIDTQIADTVSAAQTWLPAVPTLEDLLPPENTKKTYLCRVIASNDVYQWIKGSDEWTLYSDNTDYIDEEELQAAIDNEEDRAVAAEQLLQNSLDTEITNREAGDTQTLKDAKSYTDAEKTRATNEEDTLRKLITDETTARESTDSTVAANKTAADDEFTQIRELIRQELDKKLNNSTTSAETFTGNMVITGDLTVQGKTSTHDVENVTIEENLLILNRSATPPTSLSGVAILLNSDAADNSCGIVFDPNSKTFKLGLGTITEEKVFTLSSGASVALTSDPTSWSANQVPVWDATIKGFRSSQIAVVDKILIGLAGIKSSSFKLTTPQLTVAPESGNGTYNFTGTGTFSEKVSSKVVQSTEEGIFPIVQTPVLRNGSARLSVPDGPITDTIATLTNITSAIETLTNKLVFQVVAI